jgi:uncharacterized membrane protein YfcA
MFVPPLIAPPGTQTNRHGFSGKRLARWGILLFAAGAPGLAWAAGAPVATPWWIWPLALFLVCFLLGIVAVPAGIGGGVLFVPIVGGFFPFHFDFVRGAGLLVALASALAAGPGLLRAGIADLRLALPLALLASIGSIAGALLGLALPVAVVQTALGVTILGITALMWLARKDEVPRSAEPDSLAAALRLSGVYHDRGGRTIAWQARRTPLGLTLFVFIGMLAGLFGLGAGWANVPALNLVMGVPLKVAAGTSGVILSIVDSAAAWVYLNNGALLAIVVAPSVIGMMLGAFIGARLLRIMRTSTIRRLVIFMLLLAGLRALERGLGLWN